MYRLSLELTKKIYEDDFVKEVVKPKECYSNCFQVCNFSKLRDKFVNGEYKVALAYVDVFARIWVRHCVIVTNEQEIIDLSLMVNSTFDHIKDVDKREYKVFKIFDYEEYIRLIEEQQDDENGGYRCDFPNLKEEYDFYKEAKKADEFFQINKVDFIDDLLKYYNM